MGSPGRTVKKAADKVVANPVKASLPMWAPVASTGEKGFDQVKKGVDGTLGKGLKETQRGVDKVGDNINTYAYKPLKAFAKGVVNETGRNPGLAGMTLGLAPAGAGLRDMGKSYLEKQGAFAGQGAVSEVQEVPSPGDQAESDRLSFLKAKRRRELQRGGPSLLNQKVNRGSLLGANGY